MNNFQNWRTYYYYEMKAVNIVCVGKINYLKSLYREVLGGILMSEYSELFDQDLILDNIDAKDRQDLFAQVAGVLEKMGMLKIRT